MIRFPISALPACLLAVVAPGPLPSQEELPPLEETLREESGPGSAAAGSGSADDAGGEEPVIRAATPVLEASWKTNTEARALRLEVPAPRGMITDRHGEPLAQSTVVRRAALKFPLLRPDGDAEVLGFARRKFARVNEAVGEAWDLEDEDILNHYSNRRWLPLTFTPVLTEEQESILAGIEDKQLSLFASYQRLYPQGPVASHVVGFVGKIGWVPTGPAANGDPLWEAEEGRAGLELSMNDALEGESGLLSTLYAADGSKIIEELERRPVPGHTVVTTLDLAMQRRAEGILGRHMDRGAFVVLDAQTGEVRVLASWPRFDPNIWVPSISEEDFAKLRDDKDKPMLSRAFQSAYPPASTFKVPVALAVLDAGTITPETLISGPPSYFIGDRYFNNWNSSHEGMLDVKDALARSTNTWFYQVALRAGGDPLIRMSRRLGFGRTTGLPLQGEKAGFVPDHKWAQRAMGTRRLVGGSLANISIGQGALLATPLQVARAMAAVGNGTTVPGVSLVRQVQDVHHNVVERVRPVSKPLSVSAAAVEAVHEGMDRVVNAGNGTARRARIDAADLAGKTGTGQWIVAKKQNVAWFAGFVPVDNPKYAFAILYEGDPGESVSGGRSAAPLAKEFFGPLMEAEKKAEKELIADAKNKAIEEAMAQAEEAARERSAAEAATGGRADGDGDTAAIVDDVLSGITVPVAPARPVQPAPPPPPEPPRKRGLLDRLFGR